MSVRLVISALAVSAALAAPALAQQIDYRSGQYEYPTEPTAAESDTMVTQTVAETQTPGAAERVIPVRRTGPAPVFVSNPVVQSIGVAQPVRLAPQTPSAVPASVSGTPPVFRAASPAAQPPVLYTYQLAQPFPSAPVAYAYPTGGAARVIYPAGAPAPQPTPSTAYAYPQQSYVTTTAPLPVGAQVVSFDPAVWLAACRERIAGYDPEDRDAAMAALGGAALGYTPGRDHCAAYLDSYMASAAAGTLTVTPQYAQQYMLVPVTLVPLPAK